MSLGTASIPQGFFSAQDSWLRRHLNALIFSRSHIIQWESYNFYLCTLLYQSWEGPRQKQNYWSNQLPVNCWGWSAFLVDHIFSMQKHTQVLSLSISSNKFISFLSASLIKASENGPTWKQDHTSQIGGYVLPFSCFNSLHVFSGLIILYLMSYSCLGLFPLRSFLYNHQSTCRDYCSCSV